MNQSKHLNNVIKQNAVKPPLLPLEYQQVEYLQSSGTQYLNIGAIENHQYFDMDFAFVSFINNHYGTSWGINGALGCHYVNQWSARVDTELYFSRTPSITGKVHNITLGSANITANTKYNLYMSASSLKLDGQTINTTTAGAIVSPHNCYIFTYYVYGDNPLKSTCAMKLYHLQTSSVDLYPCYRKADNKPGMYDINHAVFYTNLGTGDFTMGSNV